jgi:succinoglycan biosynthesis transport protein ExoP
MQEDLGRTLNRCQAADYVDARAADPPKLTDGGHFMLQGNMLQTDRSRASLSGMAQGEQEGGGFNELVTFAFAFLRRQYVVIALTAALATAGCVAYLRVTPPTYTAHVQVLLANSRAQFVQQQSILTEPAFDYNQFETQVQILRSKAVAVAVINQLKLADDPDFSGSRPSLFSSWLRVRAWISPPPNDPQSDMPGQPPERVISAFQDRLSANRISVSNVIEISFNSSSATRAAEIANATANAYIADQLNAKFEANRTATSWLQERLRDLGEQALTAERAVNAYKSQNNVVSSGGRPLDDQQVSDLNSRLVAARAQTSDALAKLNGYEAILRASSGSSSGIGTLDAGGSDALNSTIINNLRQQYLELERREREFLPRLGRDHLAVITLRTRMRELRTSILDEVTRYTETSRSEFEVAKQRQQEIEKQLAEAVSQSRSTNSAELTIRDLESRAKGLRSLYETFLQRYMGAAQQETFPISETRVIYPASPPQSKSKPKTVLVMALGIMGGIGLGLALGLLRDVMDRVFRTSAQIEAALELPCLSLVPALRAPKPPKPAFGPHQADQNLRQLTVSPGSAIHRAFVGMPFSRFAEAIRSIKLSIDLNPTKTSNQVIGITSALPNEGKTTIAASLAQLIGHSGKSVIIVDCDLRNPSLSASLAPNAAAGIVEVINDNRPIEETVWRDPRTNLVLLPAVRRAPLRHTSEILSAESMRKLFDRLRSTYDYIIVDLPPLTPVVDVRATTPLIDCFILIVEWGRTKIDVVQHALHKAPNVYECLIGTVLNKTDIRAMTRYDTYRSDYYSNSHDARYGFSDSG